MRRLIPLVMALPLAACDAPMEEVWPLHSYAIEHGGRVYNVRAQYDPFELGYYVRVWAAAGELNVSDGPAVVAAVEEGLGPELCNGGRLDHTRSGVFSHPEGSTGLFMPELATWELLASCA